MGVLGTPGNREPAVGEGEEYELRTDADRLYDIEADAKVVGWRTDAFKALGFSAFAAAALAVRKDVDREKVQRMVGGGATPLQVAAILL